mmetsp:Transcript_25401/g.50951  ORF Transcript_25401/g.50951 Transcript_25401/m.50951 type:complete len:208 (+) Transcript_25401:2121-2744(+)
MVSDKVTTAAEGSLGARLNKSSTAPLSSGTSGLDVSTVSVRAASTVSESGVVTEAPTFILTSSSSVAPEASPLLLITFSLFNCTESSASTALSVISGKVTTAAEGSIGATSSTAPLSIGSSEFVASTVSVCIRLTVSESGLDAPFLFGCVSVASVESTLLLITSSLFNCVESSVSTSLSVLSGKVTSVAVGSFDARLNKSSTAPLSI